MNENDKKYNQNNMDELGEWIQDMVQDAVDSMDFSGLSKSFRQAMSETKQEVGRQFENGRDALKREQERLIKKPVKERQPKQRLRRLPGKWSGPVGSIFGGIGLVVFGACSLGFGLATIGSAISTLGVVMESIFLPLTLLSGGLFLVGRSIGKRAKRIEKYADIWGNEAFMMLEELSRKTGYSLKRIRKDVHFLLERKLWPNARIDEEETCLMLTEEAGRQYDAAMETKALREQEEAEKERARMAADSLPEDQKRILELQKAAGGYLQDIKDGKKQIHTEAVVKKIDRLELLLSQIFLIAGQHPENFSRIDRLTAYYLPSIVKLVGVYAEVEKQPVQGENITNTRREIEESLDTVNQALEEMHDDMYQGVAMDISSDVRVLEAMLAKDGWGEQALRSAGETGRSIWE